MNINHFIKNKIKNDLDSNLVKKIVLRFPPEPNGYLHLGHVKSIVLNSSLAEEFNGEFNLRFDDTNPEKENTEYVNSILKDTKWMAKNITRVVWTSDYFDKLFECAIFLIENNLAYVDDNNIDTIKELRGNFNNIGTNSIYRDRSIEENLSRFKEMKEGKHNDGEKVLRAKIDMAHPNINMRDPIIYRICHASHHNTGNKWCIYPMYDYAHPLSDAIEGITHSLCTLEFEDHRPLYNWFVDKCYPILKHRPEEIEFARLDVEGIILSKRKLNNLVKNKDVSGWDSPMMPTISGLRNRGYTSNMLYNFITKTGISKANSLIPYELLESCAREELNPISERRMSVINPVLLEIENWNEREETIIIPNHPKNKDLGERNLPFNKYLWIEEEDIRETMENDFWRVFPGNWVRLKHAYNILIKEVIMDDNKPIKVIAELDFESKNMKMAKHKAKTSIHWLSVESSSNMECYFYNKLCDDNGEFNSNSLIIKTIKVEPNVLLKDNIHFEFERTGYFYINNEKCHALSLLKK